MLSVVEVNCDLLYSQLTNCLRRIVSTSKVKKNRLFFIKKLCIKQSRKEYSKMQSVQGNYAFSNGSGDYTIEISRLLNSWNLCTKKCVFVFLQ